MFFLISFCTISTLCIAKYTYVDIKSVIFISNTVSFALTLIKRAIFVQANIIFAQTVIESAIYISFFIIFIFFDPLRTCIGSTQATLGIADEKIC